MKSFKKHFAVLLLSAMVLVLALPVTTHAAVKLNKTNISVTVKKTYKLKISGTKKKVKWTSSNKKIATVSSKGVVKGVKKGTCTVTATVGKKKYKCKVTVKNPKYLSVSSTKCSFKNSGSVTVTFKKQGEIFYNIADPSVVSCSWGKWDGNKIKLKFTAKKTGTTKVTISNSVNKEKITITVNAKVSNPDVALLNNLKDNFKAQLIVPSVGSSTNSYCQVKFTNHTGSDVELTGHVYANGYGCVNLSASGYTLESGYYVVSSFYRDIIASERYHTKDMYLDNNSTAYTYIKTNGKTVVVKFDTKGNSEFAYHPNDLGIY